MDICGLNILSLHCALMNLLALAGSCVALVQPSDGSSRSKLKDGGGWTMGTGGRDCTGAAVGLLLVREVVVAVVVLPIVEGEACFTLVAGVTVLEFVTAAVDGVGLPRCLVVVDTACCRVEDE